MRLKNKLKLFDISKKRKTYIVTTSRNDKKISFFKSKKFKIIQLANLQDKKDFNRLFQILFQIGKRRLLIESGLIFLNKVMDFKLVNNLYIFKSHNQLKKNGFNNTKFRHLKKLSNKNKLRINLNNENLFKIKIK